MCQSVYTVDTGKLLTTARQLAEYLGVQADALVTCDGEPMSEMVGGDWRDACLCPFEVEHNLDLAKIWHRRDLEGDQMRTFAMKP